jgi:hypothetical protein
VRWDAECAILPVNAGVEVAEPRETYNDIFPAQVGDEEVGPGGVVVDSELKASEVGEMSGGVGGSVNVLE